MPLGFGVDDRGRVFVVASKIVTGGAVSQYEKNTDRAFPVIVLEGVPAPA